MEDRTPATAEQDDLREAWAVIEGDAATRDRYRVLLLVVDEDEALVLMDALSRRGTNARVVAITDLDRAAMPPMSTASTSTRKATVCSPTRGSTS